MAGTRPTSTFVLNLVGGTLVLWFSSVLSGVYSLGLNGAFIPSGSWVGPLLLVSNIAFYEWPERHLSLGATMFALSTVSLFVSVFLIYPNIGITIFRLVGLFTLVGSIVSMVGAVKTLLWKT